MTTIRHANNKRICLQFFSLIFLLCFILIPLACKLPLNQNPLPTATLPRKEVAAANSIKASPAPPTKAASILSPQPAATLTKTSVWASGTETVVSPSASGTYREPYWFRDQDCGCASFPAKVEASFGPGYLECNYRWGGQYIDDNALSFIIQQYPSSADLEATYNEHLGWLYDSSKSDKESIEAGSWPGHEQYIARNEKNGFTFVTTGPGGGSSKTNGEIPMCGNGSGIIRSPEDYLVEIRLFACDLGDDRQVYQTAIETLEDCALSNIEKAMTAAP